MRAYAHREPTLSLSGRSRQRRPANIEVSRNLAAGGGVKHGRRSQPGLLLLVLVLVGLVLVGVVLLVLLGMAHVSAAAWKSAAPSSAQKLRWAYISPISPLHLPYISPISRA